MFLNFLKSTIVVWDVNNIRTECKGYGSFLIITEFSLNLETILKLIEKRIAFLIWIFSWAQTHISSVWCIVPIKYFTGPRSQVWIQTYLFKQNTNEVVWYFKLNIIIFTSLFYISISWGNMNKCSFIPYRPPKNDEKHNSTQVYLNESVSVPEFFTGIWVRVHIQDAVLLDMTRSSWKRHPWCFPHNLPAYCWESSP